MAYDAARDTIVRYGGALPVAGAGFAWPTTTWTWNGTTCIPVATDGPVGRTASQMVYDSRRREVVLFGGQGEAPARGATQPVFGDTWIWNGLEWRRGPVEGPTPRSFHAMSSDSRAGLVLVYGGARGDQILNDLWAWDGTRWTPVPQPGINPGRRRLHAMTYDAARNPAGADRLRLRDHGNEVVVGLVLLYALEHDLRREREPAYRAAIATMLDRILASTNEDGMLYNEIRPSDLQPLDRRLSDNWGYVYGGVYTFYMITGEPRYTNCVLALNARTGELKWHYQFTPHDLRDRDATEPNVLVDTVYQGKPSKLVLHAGRNGFFYVLDRTNGTVLLAKTFLPRVDWASGIGRDGRPVIEDPRGCPGDAANWSSTAYSPETRLYYFLALEECVGDKPGGYPDETGQRFLRALNIETGDIVWEVPQPGAARAKTWSGVLATAGGLIFYGQPNGGFTAVDQRDGKTLWHFPTNVRMKASAMTFAMAGQQYVAVAARAEYPVFWFLTNRFRSVTGRSHASPH